MYVLREPRAVLCFDASLKIQNNLRSAFTLCWAMVRERCASSGGQGRHLYCCVLGGVAVEVGEQGPAGAAKHPVETICVQIRQGCRDDVEQGLVSWHVTRPGVIRSP